MSTTVPARKARKSAQLFCLAFVLSAVADAETVHAKSAVQQSRDGSLILVSKDIGAERWAISYDLSQHIVVGNVFFPNGGDAAFIWCEELRTNGDSDPRRVQRTFGCYGAGACEGEPCTSAEWNFISEITLPGEFFLPPATSLPEPTATPAPIILPTATRTPTPSPTAIADPLQAIVGTWTFETTIQSVFFDHYRLDHVETIDGVRAIVGTDLDDGGVIVVARPEDLSDEPFPYEFAMLDPGSGICDFFVFNRTGTNTVAGADVLMTVSGGRCAGFLTGRLNPMVGTRTSTLASGTATAASAHATEVTANREVLAVAEDAGTVSVAADPDAKAAAFVVATRMSQVLEGTSR